MKQCTAENTLVCAYGIIDMYCVPGGRQLPLQFVHALLRAIRGMFLASNIPQAVSFNAANAYIYRVN